ncbi:acidic mammalian chitinase-like [Haliotis rufescens]|uniref:acidic mammalian chitinase-like n=1 Tax=Haliotis rufescens TaxID=6454 RepID=UPI00201E9BE5|nr:acidic mammalian chitinase-like [Haliotis rufescens]
MVYICKICVSFKTGWTRVWDEEQLVPYAYSGDQWVGYDDSQSFDFKVQYVIDEHLGGVMFWELSYDDAKNYCKKGPFPLLNLVKQTFANHHKETNHTSTMETSSSNIVSQTTGATDQTTTAFSSPSHSGRATTAPINDGITFTGTTSILVLTVCGIRVYT